MTRPKSFILVVSAKCQRGKKKKSLLSFTKHAHLLVFLFYCISHCYKPSTAYFFFFPLMVVTFQSQVSPQTMRQMCNTQPEMLVKIPTNSPSIFFFWGSQPRKPAITPFRVPVRGKCGCQISHYHFGV